MHLGRLYPPRQMFNHFSHILSPSKAPHDTVFTSWMLNILQLYYIIAFVACAACLMTEKKDSITLYEVMGRMRNS